MSTGATVVVIVVVLVVIALVAALVMRRGGVPQGLGSGMRLKRRFGPEYDRTLQRHDGDEKATRHELGERLKRFGGIELRPVTGEEAEQYNDRWAALQARFVDEPGRAVSDADRLIAELATERGFPGAESPEHFDALSVHHPYQVQGYRHAHLMAEHGGAGSGGPRATEDLRQAILSARELFTELVRGYGSAQAIERPQGKQELTGRQVTGREAVAGERSAADEKAAGYDAEPAALVPAQVAAPAESGTERHRPLGARLAGLTGSRRNHTDEAD